MPYRFDKGLANGIRPDPQIDYVEWADSYFYLPRQAASEYGRYRTSRTPFVREVLLELSPQSNTQVVIVKKPTQCAGTTIGLVFMCGMADLYPGPFLLMMPTDQMAKSFSRKRLDNVISNIPRLRAKVSENKSRDASNTMQQKDFPGGSWLMSGSNSPASYRSESIKYLILDDFDGFAIDIGGEGSPEELADRRTGSFPGRKIYINSTTTVRETSNIEAAFERSSQGYYSVPCPHCGHLQYLVWGGIDVDHGIKFKRDDNGLVVDAWYVCESCLQRIDEHKKPWMLENGQYVHRFPERKVRGFVWNALYTPLGWVNSWAYIAEKFLEAKKAMDEGRPNKMKTWMNSFMSEPWDEPGDSVEWEQLAERVEEYEPQIVPAKGWILTAGVDTQDDRLIVVVRAWGDGEESWLVYHTEIWGDPAQDRVWDELDTILAADYAHENGPLKIATMAIDSGGHRTQAVYNYARVRYPRVIAVKGSNERGKPVITNAPTKQDVDFEGQRIKNGVQLWTVGVDSAKEVIYSRLRMAGTGSGVYHWPAGTSDAYFKQISSEKLVTRYVKGYPRREWHAFRANHALDCEVYAYAAAIRAGIDRPGFWGKAKQVIYSRRQQVPVAYNPGRRRVISTGIDSYA